MSDYFKSWRRKVGVATLVMACVLTGGWVRSLTRTDFVAIDCKNATYRLGSYGGVLCFIRDTPEFEFQRFMDWTSRVEKVALTNETPPRRDDEVWRWDGGPFHFGAYTVLTVLEAAKNKARTEEYYIFPYWFFASALTFISLLLLLSKRRNSAQKKQ